MSARHTFLHLLSLTVLAGSLAAQPAFAGDAATHRHEHEHPAQAPAKLMLDAGKKWGTDAPLRQAMGNIRSAIEASLHAIHDGKLKAAQYGALAKKVNGEVSYAIGNCKLDAKADAQLHLIIADLLRGVEIMDGRAKGKPRRDGALTVLAALENYGNYFDDPGWKPLAH